MSVEEAVCLYIKNKCKTFSPLKTPCRSTQVSCCLIHRNVLFNLMSGTDRVTLELPCAQLIQCIPFPHSWFLFIELVWLKFPLFSKRRLICFVILSIVYCLETRSHEAVINNALQPRLSLIPKGMSDLSHYHWGASDNHCCYFSSYPVCREMVKDIVKIPRGKRSQRENCCFSNPAPKLDEVS